MRRARCKFTVTQAEGTPGSPGEYDEQKVLMHTQYDENDPEDTKFSAATPWGTLEFGVSNPNLADFFEVGEEFYVDLVRVQDWDDAVYPTSGDDYVPTEPEPAEDEAAEG
jgi:hypothetical protein